MKPITKEWLEYAKADIRSCENNNKQTSKILAEKLDVICFFVSILLLAL